jgi:hypothetical protein
MQVRLRRLRRRQPDARPSDLMARRRPRRFRAGRAIRLRWPLHLAGWLLGAVPAVLVGGWAWLAVGPAAFEVVLFATTLRVSRRAARGGGGRPDGPWGAGDREPRRPLPVAGAGAAAVPLPTEQWYAKPGLTS